MAVAFKAVNQGIASFAIATGSDHRSTILCKYLCDGFTNALFLNPGTGNHTLALELVGTTSNRSAIGARIRVEVEHDGERRSVYAWVNAGGSFGANPLRQSLGLGAARVAKVVEVYWPTSDTTQVFHDLEAGPLYRITESSPTPERVELR